MLSPAEVDALLAARHADPFSVLGLHADAAGRLWLRALLPGALSVEVLEAASGKPVVALKLRHAGGLFEAPVGRRRKRFDYRLAVRWSAEETEQIFADTYADAYAYGPQLAEPDLQRFAQGQHPRPFELLGAHPLRLARLPAA